MPGAVIESLGDLLSLTLPQLPKKYTQTLRQTDYPLTRIFFSEMKKSLRGGKWYEKRIRLRARGTFQFVNIYEATGAIQQDLMGVQATPWIHWMEKMPYDDREIDINDGAPQIVELMQERRDGSYEAIYNGHEDDLGLAPQSASDRKHLTGLPFWFRTLALNAEDPIGDFNGITAYYRGGTSTTLHDTSANALDRSVLDNQRLRNFVGTYSGVADEQFFDLLRRAITRTNFGTLVELGGEAPAASTPDSCMLLADHDMNDQMVRRINKGPDDQNGDVERFTEGKFAGIRFVRVPTFGSIAYRPVYGIKRSKVKGIVLKDRWMKELKALNSQATPETWVVPIVGTCNLTCDDVRSGGFVLHTKRTAA